jgi:hypothetical protein
VRSSPSLIINPRGLSYVSRLSKRGPAGSGEATGSGEGHQPEPQGKRPSWWRRLGQKWTGKQAKPTQGKRGGTTEPITPPGDPDGKSSTQGPDDPNWRRMYDGVVHTVNVYHPYHKRPSGNLEARDWDDLEKRYWDDLELDARNYDYPDDFR